MAEIAADLELLDAAALLGRPLRSTRSPEQLAVEGELARQRSRLGMREQKARLGELSRRIRQRDAAVAALPTAELRAEARSDDFADFPPWRHMAALDVVVKGGSANKGAAAETEAVDAETRSRQEVRQRRTLGVLVD